MSKLEDNCIHNVISGGTLYNFGYTVGNSVLQWCVSGAAKHDFWPYIWWYTSTNEQFEYIWALSRQNLSSGFPTKRDSNQSPELQRLQGRRRVFKSGPAEEATECHGGEHKREIIPPLVRGVWGASPEKILSASMWVFNGALCVCDRILVVLVTFFC